MATRKSTVPEPFYLNTEDGKLMLTVDQIKVGERHRKGKGKLAALKKSISDVGQLQPIVVDVQCNLIAGWRRLIALTELGLDAEVTIARDLDDATAALRAERDENLCREPFTAAEALSLADAIKAILRPAAVTRQKAGKKTSSTESGDAGEPSRNLRTGTTQRVDEQAAEQTGRSAATLRKVEKIKTVAFDQDAPAASRALANQFWDECEKNADVKIDPLYKALMAQLQADDEAAARVLAAVDSTEPEPGEQVDPSATVADLPATVADESGGTDPAPAEKAPPKPRITTLINDVVASLTGIAAVLDTIYTDERFEKIAQGPAASKIGVALGEMTDAFAKATAVLSEAEVSAALAETAADPRYTVDPTTENEA